MTRLRFWTRHDLGPAGALHSCGEHPYRIREAPDDGRLRRWRALVLQPDAPPRELGAQRTFEAARLTCEIDLRRRARERADDIHETATGDLQ